MRVRGEEWILFSFLMNCLCLLSPVAMELAQGRMLRLSLTALFFAVLGAVQKLLPPFFVSPAVILLTPLLMALCAFGRAQAARAGIATLAAGFFLSGLSAYLTGRGISPTLIVLLSSLCLLPLYLIGRRKNMPIQGMLTVYLDGRAYILRAIVDSGNVLSDGKALVVVVPRRLISLPDECLTPGNLKGYCLLSAETVAGRALMAAFRPDQMCLKLRGQTHELKSARIALSPVGEYALIPPSLIKRGADYVEPKALGVHHQADREHTGKRRLLRRRQRPSAKTSDAGGRA